MRELAPELALGIAEGQERDAALRHLSGGCRQVVAERSSVGDELLQLAPAHDPPAGFESRVLAGLTEPPRRRSIRPLAHRWRRCGPRGRARRGVGVPGHDRRASARRQLPGGPEPGTRSLLPGAPLKGARGRVGTVFGYQGQPPWVMTTLQPSIQEEGRFEVQVVTRDGRYLSLGEAVLGGAKGTWGGQLPVDLSAVHELRFVGSDGRPTLTATFDTTNPWD